VRFSILKRGIFKAPFSLKEKGGGMSQKGQTKINDVMSASNNKKLRQIARVTCRELRKNQTNAEKIFWEHVRNRKFMGLKINRQFPIFYDFLGKESFYIADFYCHEKKLVIELDGKIHERQKEQDKLRTEIINLLGIRVIRFKNEEVEQNIDNVLSKITKIITHPKSLSPQ